MSVPNSEEPFDRAVATNAELSVAISELCGWTTVSDIIFAAKSLHRAGQGAPDLILIPFDEDSAAEKAILTCLTLLCAVYKCPPAKIQLARAMAPQIPTRTWEQFGQLALRPNGYMVPSALSQKFQREYPDVQRMLLLEDQPAAIACAMKPVRALVSLLKHHLKFASEISTVQHQRKLSVIHEPHSDSALFGMLEALCLKQFGVNIGTVRATPSARPVIQLLLRSAVLMGQPPFSSDAIAAARDAYSIMSDAHA